MEKIARILIALIAALMIVYGLGFWFQIEMMNDKFALSTQNDLGFASIRADFGSLFLSVGVFSAYATWTRNGQWALAAAILFIIAFIGRMISLGFDGPVPGGVPPMLFEAGAAAVLLWARSLWRNSA